jgi:hypothetical protein
MAMMIKGPIGKFIETHTNMVNYKPSKPEIKVFKIEISALNTFFF